MLKLQSNRHQTIARICWIPTITLGRNSWVVFSLSPRKVSSCQLIREAHTKKKYGLESVIFSREKNEEPHHSIDGEASLPHLPKPPPTLREYLERKERGKAKSSNLHLFRTSTWVILRRSSCMQDVDSFPPHSFFINRLVFFLTPLMKPQHGLACTCTESSYHGFSFGPPSLCL